MAHGIDTTIDKVFSTSGTEWHKIAIPVEKITTETINPILFPIIESPAFISVDGNNIQLPDYKVLCADYRGIRDDLSIVPLHIPREGYQVINNRAVWETMQKSFKDIDAKVVTVGTLESGRKFFVSINIGDSEMIINKDKFKFFMSFISSHDGTLAMNTYDTSYRIVCCNTLRMSLLAKGDVDFKVYHTKNADLAMKNLPELVNAILLGRTELKNVMEFLATCSVDSNDALAMAAGYFATTTEDTKLSTRSYNAATEIAGLFSRGIGCNGRNLYDLANAATQYWTNGEGTGKSTGKTKTTDKMRVYRANMGTAAAHKEDFVAMLADDNSRARALEMGREAVTLALAK